MIHPEYVHLYVSQYRRVPELVSQPYDSVIGEQVLNHLLDRDALEEQPELTADLTTADHNLAKALSSATPEWWDHLQKWSVQCGFVGSLWWITTCYTAKRPSSTSLSLVEILKGAADAWIKVATDGGVRVRSLIDGFQGAMQIGIVHNTGVVPETKPRVKLLPAPLYKFARVVPAVVLPGSVVVGLELPRKTPGEPASGPAEISVEALDFVLTASDRYDPQDTPDALADLLDDQYQRDKLWKSLGCIYNAAGREADSVELSSNVPQRERSVVWQIKRKRPRPRQVHPQRTVKVTGNVRAIDMDNHSMRLRVPGAPWATTVDVEASLFIHPEKLGSRLGSDITVRGHTRETTDPLRLLTALEVIDE